MDHIDARIREFIRENFLFGDDSRMPTHDESLLAAGVMDSTGVLELIEFLESDLGIPVDDAETVPQNLDSIDALVGFVERKRAPSAAPPPASMR